ncbi:hypothetical protein AB0M20_19305 [Actinoplanes sp. NPDC051633]|uniref:hypothetical protein n=1 Tax=Actinoplanes sp. NPDC051633 TaxID=3155670 RepID=UPI003440A21C
MCLVTAILAVFGPSAPPAYADDSAPAVLGTWAPDSIAGSWRTNPPADPGTRSLSGRQRCPGQQRSWKDAVSGRAIAVVWWACSSRDESVWLAALEDAKSASPEGLQALAPVFDGDEEIVSAADSVYLRQWMAGRFIIEVQTRCPGQSRTPCLRLNQQVSRELAANMTQRPSKITGSRSQQFAAFLLALLIANLTGIGLTASVNRLRRRLYQVSTTSGSRYFTVDDDARRQRRQARQQRFGVLLVLPLAVDTITLLPSMIDGTVSTGDIGGPLVLSLPASAGIVLLARSRDPYPRFVWPKATGAGRWLNRGLSLLSYVLVAIIVVCAALASAVRRSRRCRSRWSTYLARSSCC